MVRIGVASRASGGIAALTLLDIAVAVAVVALLGRIVGRWLRDPQHAARRQYDDFRNAGTVRSIDAAGMNLLLLAGFYVYAALRADLRWFWGGYAMVLLLLAAAAALTSWYSRRDPTIIPQRTFGPPTPDQLTRLVAAGWRRIWLRVATLLLWAYSWRDLIHS